MLDDSTSLITYTLHTEVTIIMIIYTTGFDFETTIDTETITENTTETVVLTLDPTTPADVAVL